MFEDRRGRLEAEGGPCGCTSALEAKSKGGDFSYDVKLRDIKAFRPASPPGPLEFARRQRDMYALGGEH